MIKFEMVESDKEYMIAGVIVRPGERVLKITFDRDDIFDSSRQLQKLKTEGGNIMTDPRGIIYVYGKKLEVLEELLQFSKFKGGKR